MVVLSKIYTRTGDKGTTALGSGERGRQARPAHLCLRHGGRDQRHHRNGAHPPWCRAPGLDAKLLRIQNDLFDLGADLCVPDRGQKLEYEPLRMTEGQVKRLEEEIDEMNAELKAAAFLRPAGRLAGVGGAACGAHRLAPRRATDGRTGRKSNEPVAAEALKYINRLSDFLFVASRYVNDRGP